jgi:hypothetical protein
MVWAFGFVVWRLLRCGNSFKFTISMTMTYFAESAILDHEVLRPLDHIFFDWELSWDNDKKKYDEEETTYAALLNELIEEIEQTAPPADYHESEDRLAKNVIRELKWNIRKEGQRWVGEDYILILEQGGFSDVNERDLVLAATGRVQAARKRGQNHFDEMEDRHRAMLSAIMVAILYHRTKWIEDEARKRLEERFY